MQILPGFTPIANQLDNGGNTLNEIMIEVPPGSSLLKWNPATQEYVQAFYEFTGWSPNLTLNPGEGAFFHSDFPFTLVLSGQPHQPALPVELPTGQFAFLSRQTNDVGTYETIVGTPPVEGVTVYQYDTDAQPDPGDFSGWRTYTFSDGLWLPEPPMAQVGEPLMFSSPGGEPPFIVTPPATHTAVNCTDTSFQVEATGSEPLSYQWLFNGFELPDATNAVLTLTDVQFTQSGGYSVLVTNAVGVMMSEEAQLFVENVPPVITCPASFTVAADPGGCAAVEVDLGLPTATDECGPVEVANDAPPVFPLGDTLVTWQAMDQSGETAACTQVVTVEDQEAPTFTVVPPDRVLVADDTCAASVPNLLAEVGANDACAPVSLTQNPGPGTAVGLGDILVSIAADDGAGNTNTVTVVVTVNDVTPPTLTNVPADQTLEADEACGTTVPNLLSDVVATDACGPATLRQTPEAGTVLSIGDTLVSIAADDGAGNTNTETVVLSVVDSVPPVLLSVPSDQTLEADEACGAAVPNLLADVVATDACGTVTLRQVPAAGTRVGLGLTVVSISASDGASNTNTATVSLTVEDVSPPTFTSVPPPMTIPANADCTAAAPNLLADVEVGDACGTVSLAQDPVAGTLLPLGDTLVTIIAHDGANNTNTVTIPITVADTTPPVIIEVPPTQVLPANENCQAAVPDLTGSVIAEDVCGTVNVQQNPPTGTIINTGATELTFLVTDGAGNTSTGHTTIIVTDTSRPHLPSCAGPPVLTEAGGYDDFQTPTPTQPRSTLAALVLEGSRMFDEFTPDRPFAHSFIELPECVAEATLTIHLRADEGQPEDDLITVGFTDATGFNPLTTWRRPIGSGALGPGLLEQPWTTGSDVELTLDLGQLPLADGTTLDLQPALARNLLLDVLISNNTAVDYLGLSYKTCSAGPDIVVPNDPGQSGAIVTFPLPEFVDDCDPAPMVTAKPESGSFFPLGRTVVFFMGEDVAGNIGRAKRWIEVTDVDPPTLHCSNQVLICTKPQVAAFYPIKAEDNSGEAFIECVPPSGTIFSVGTVPVICTATDPSGNSAQCSFDVTVLGRIAPSIQSFARTETNFTLVFDTQRGLDYAVEFKNALADGEWAMLTTVTGTGEHITVQDEVGPATSRFYRVGLVDFPITGDITNVFEPPEPPPAQPGTGEVCRDTCGPPFVYLFSGELHYATTDLCIKGRGLDFVWARKYRSCLCLVTPMGYGWDYSYNICIVPRGPDLDLYDGNTRQDTYYRQSDGTFAANQFFREGQFGTNGQFVLTFADKGVWEFLPLDGGPAQGRIARIADRNGNALTFTYSDRGLLTNITDTLDRDIAVSYDNDGFIEAVTDFTGRQVRYEHYQDGDTNGSFGDLKAAISPAVIDAVNGNNFPGGKTNIYAYTTPACACPGSHLLRTITDGKGQTWLENTFEPPIEGACSRVVRQVWGYSNEVLNFHYVAQTPSPANGFAITKAIVNDRVGNVSECYFDAGNRPVLHREFTGRAVPDQPTTDTTNRPQNPLRPDDPAFYDTRQEWNIDSLVTRVVYPNGNSTESTYERDLNPAAPPRFRGNLRICRKLPGPLGGDQPELVETFEYEDGFGSCCGRDFVTKHTDARNHVTLHFYDDRGNRRHTQHRLPAVIEDFEYNQFGQMTAHVLPDNGSGHRRRDEYVYYDSGPQRGYRAQEIVDAGGLTLTTTYEYDAVGNVVRTVDPRNHDTLYDVNALDQVLRETSREVTPGSGIRYRRDFYYDANNNVVRVDVENRDETGQLQPNTHFSTIFDYDILNYPVRATKEKGSADLPASVLSSEAIPFRLRPEFLATEYAYDANRNRTLVRYGEAVAGYDPFNLVRSEYDERDLLFLETRGAGSGLQSTTQHDYDGNRNLIRRSQGLEDNPRVTHYAYDGYNRQLQVTDAMANVTTDHYDANGNRVAERLDGEMQDQLGGAGNRRLAETFWRYDAMDRLERLDQVFFDPQNQQPLDDGSATTWFVYNDNSQLLQVTDDRTNSTWIAYDSANRTNTVTDVRSNQVVYAYDPNGNLRVRTAVELSDLGNPPLITAVTNEYDGLDRLVRATDNGNSVRQYAYDSRNNRTWQSDPRGNLTHFSYDGLSRLIAIRREMTDTGDGSGNVIDEITTRQIWDDTCRLIAQIDDNTNVTRYAYDSLNRRMLTRMADGTLNWVGYGTLDWPADQDRPPLNEFVVNGYDVHDNALLTTDADGTSVATMFDLLDRPISRSIARGPGVLGSSYEIRQYDGRSLLVQAQNDDSLVTRAYDSLGNRIRETLNFESPSFPPVSDHLTAWMRDGVGNAVALTYPGGAHGALRLRRPQPRRADVRRFVRTWITAGRTVLPRAGAD